MKTPEEHLAAAMGCTLTDLKEYDAVPKAMALKAVEDGQKVAYVQAMADAEGTAKKMLTEVMTESYKKGYARAMDDVKRQGKLKLEL